MYKVQCIHLIDTNEVERVINVINRENGVIKFVEHEKYDMYIIYEVGE